MNKKPYYTSGSFQITPPMKFRLSEFVSKPSNSSAHLDEKGIEDDAESVASTVVRNKILTPPFLNVKRVDYYYNSRAEAWKYRVCTQLSSSNVYSR